MAQQYNQYGGNPYGGTVGGNPYSETAGGNPYGDSSAGGYGSSNPYGSSAPRQQGGLQAPAALSQQASNYSQTSNYSGTGANYSSGVAPIPVPHHTTAAAPLPNQGTLLSVPDFLARVETAKASIRDLTTNISQIGQLHQRALSSTDNSASSQLEHLVSQTQILNAQIKDQIRFFETDAARSGGNTTKDSQIRTLKQSFKGQLEQYRAEEQTYKTRYQEQIARQIRIVNPDATEAEIQEAAQADWGNEGVFQTALKSNRAGHATSVLGAVRARHNDIQQIEKTLIELNQLFEDLAEAVILQDAVVQQTEEQTTKVKEDTEAANVQLGKGIEHAKRARKLKWWCFFIVLAIIIILGLVLGLYFGLNAKK